MPESTRDIVVGSAASPLLGTEGSDVLAAIFRDLPEAVLTWGRQGLVNSFNPSAERLFGLAWGEVLSRPAALLFSTATGVEIPANALLEELEVEGSWFGCRRDGSRFPVELRVTSGQLRGEPYFIAVVRDITERKRAELALAQARDQAARHSRALSELASKQTVTAYSVEASLARVLLVAIETLAVEGGSVWTFEDRYATLRMVVRQGHNKTHRNDESELFAFSDSPDLIESFWIHRTQGYADGGTRPDFGPFHEQAFGPIRVGGVLAAQVRVGGSLWGMLFLEDTAPRRQWSLEEEQFAGSVADFMALRIEDHRRKTAEEAVRKMNAELEERVQRRTEELQASYTELQEAMQQLKETQTQLVQSEKMAALGELVAGIAHEINTPIGIAVTAASHFDQKTRDFSGKVTANQLKRSDLDAYTRLSEETARMLLVNLERAAELVQSFKKVAVDQSSEARRAFNLKRYTEEVLISLRPRIKKTPLKVELNCPDNIEINSYPGAYSQIITNLVVNAIMHAYEPDQPGTLSLDFTLDHDDVLFEFSDDGKGIDEGIIGRIFDPFFTTKRGAGGSGLGLHILYNIISGTLGGGIEVFSTVGAGTRFRLRMPINPGELGRGE